MNMVFHDEDITAEMWAAANWLVNDIAKRHNLELTAAAITDMEKSIAFNFLIRDAKTIPYIVEKLVYAAIAWADKRPGCDRDVMLLDAVSAVKKSRGMTTPKETH